MKNNIILFIVAFLAINSIFAAETKDDTIIANESTPTTISLYSDVREAWGAMSAPNAILPDIDKFIATIKEDGFASDGSEDSVFFLVIYYLKKLGIKNILDYAK